jgi:preprotein translocase subunit SecF
MARSINTSLTTILALIVSYFIFGYYVKSLILTLIFGIVIGTYSSIFIASPLVYEFYKNKLK